MATIQKATLNNFSLDDDFIESCVAGAVDFLLRLRLLVATYIA